MNELLPHPLLCWYATSGASGHRSGNQPILGNAKQYSDMEFLHISRYGLGRTDFLSRFLRRCSLWCSTDSCGQIHFIKLWIFACISAHLSNKHHIFRILLTLDNCRYQPRKRNIMKFYLLIPKHLIIQLVKLQIDNLKPSTSFLTLKKIPITFEQGCIW